MRAAAVIAIFAATAMAQTGGTASPTNGTSTTGTGKPTSAPTSGANSLSQNILLGCVDILEATSFTTTTEMAAQDVRVNSQP
ncbi:hypothetical protein T069G_03050 [Trichoderma breve]|uniref:Uncharacterized protein n=1 Tax=Trichoderma breve TaxID=2034170 RepID=A0A9W9BLT7_9HYPO|nr:hypothetical protein T069G_03050 [Trichoderma breve]KAJ4862096.1 hypothetical protein T069G_03050 [Trichoderma breve]